MNDEIYTSRSGKQTPVAELAEEHIRNILRMILRTKREQDEQKRLALEAQYRADNIYTN